MPLIIRCTLLCRKYDKLYIFFGTSNFHPKCDTEIIEGGWSFTKAPIKETPSMHLLKAESFRGMLVQPGWWGRGINHWVKQGRLLRFINGNDLSICWSQFTRVSWARLTMGQPTYELPAPLQRVHKTTGNAAGEHPETPPSCTDHQMTQMGRNQTKTRLPLYKEVPLWKPIHATNWGKLAMQHSRFALLLAWTLCHSKWNQIYGALHKGS